MSDHVNEAAHTAPLPQCEDRRWDGPRSRRPSPSSNTTIRYLLPVAHSSTGLLAARRTAATRTCRLDRPATGDAPALSRSRTGALLALRVSELVVTGYCRLVCSLVRMGNS